jgi:RNA polymerase sigma-70 factor (ECF subfamily)
MEFGKQDFGLILRTVPTIEFDANLPPMTAENEACRMEQNAFREFYLKVAPALRGYLCHSCGCVELAEDLMQEAFMRFLRTAPGNMDEKAMKSYVYRTAESLLVDHWRHSKLSRGLLATWLRPSSSSRQPHHEHVTEAFGNLKPQQQSLLWLAYVEGYDHREIAEATGVRERSVKVLLFRARKALAAILEGL